MAGPDSDRPHPPGGYATSGSRDLLGRAQAETEAETRFREMIEKIQRNLLDSGIIAAYALSTATLSDEICVYWRARGDTEVQTLMEKRYKRHWQRHLTKAHFQHKQHHSSKAIIPEVSVNGPEKGEDGHHSPTGPDEYVRWRITPLLEFYRGRCPVHLGQFVFELVKISRKWTWKSAFLVFSKTIDTTFIKVSEKNLD